MNGNDLANRLGFAVYTELGYSARNWLRENKPDELKAIHERTESETREIFSKIDDDFIKSYYANLFGRRLAENETLQNMKEDIMSEVFHNKVHWNYIDSKELPIEVRRRMVREIEARGR